MQSFQRYKIDTLIRLARITQSEELREKYISSADEELKSLSELSKRIKSFNDKGTSLERSEAKDFILEFLSDGIKETSKLDEAALLIGISKNALKNAKSDLSKMGIIKTWSEGYGKNKVFYSCILNKV